MIPDFEQHLFNNGLRQYEPRQGDAAQQSTLENKRSFLGNRIQRLHLKNNGEEDMKDDGMQFREQKKYNSQTWKSAAAKATNTIRVAYEDDQIRDLDEEAQNYSLYDFEVRAAPDPEVLRIREKPMLPIRTPEANLNEVSSHICAAVIGANLLNACKASDLQGAKIIIQGIKSYTILAIVLEIQDSTSDKTALTFISENNSLKQLTETIIEKLVELLYGAYEEDNAYINDQNNILERLLSFGIGLSRILSTLAEKQINENRILHIEQCIRTRADCETFIGHDLLSACADEDLELATRSAQEISSYYVLSMQDTFGNTALFYAARNDSLRHVADIIVTKLTALLYESIQRDSLNDTKNLIDLLFINRVEIDKICSLLTDLGASEESIATIKCLYRQRVVLHISETFNKFSDPNFDDQLKYAEKIHLDLCFEQLQNDEAAITEISNYLLTNKAALSYTIMSLNLGSELIIEKLVSFLFEAFKTENEEGLNNIIGTLLENKVWIKKVRTILEKHGRSESDIADLEKFVTGKVLSHIYELFNRFLPQRLTDAEIRDIILDIRVIFGQIRDDKMAIEDLVRYLLTNTKALHYTIKHLKNESEIIIEELIRFIHEAFKNGHGEILGDVTTLLVANRVEIEKICQTLSNQELDMNDVLIIKQLLEEKYVMLLYEIFKDCSKEEFDRLLALVLSYGIEIRFIIKTLDDNVYRFEDVIQIDNLVKEKIVSIIYEAHKVALSNESTNIQKNMAISSIKIYLKQLYAHGVKIEEIYTIFDNQLHEELATLKDFVKSSYQTYDLEREIGAPKIDDFDI